MIVLPVHVGGDISVLLEPFYILAIDLYPEHKLFIGMLPKNVTEAEVSVLFSKHGNIKDLQILRGPQQTSKGTICFLTYF